jgi:RND family efflux transporter MFP subunit
MTDPLSSELAQLRIDRSPAKKRSGRWLLTVLVTAIIIVPIGLLVVYGGPKISASLGKQEVEVTEVALVSPAQATIDLTSTGYVVPQRVAKVGAKVTGRITKTNIREGQEVKTGDVLFELDPSDQKSAVASAQARVLAAQARAQTARANVTEVKQQYEREKKLAATGAVAQATADDLAARVDALEAQVKAADADVVASKAEVSALSTTLGNFQVMAPIDGAAVTKPAEVGDIVGPMSVLVELVDFASLLIETDVPEGRMGIVKPDGPCEIIFDAYPDKRARGSVVEIGPRMNRAKATGLVKVKVLDVTPGVRPEMAARVSFLTKALDPAQLAEPPKIVVPDSAVADRNGAKVVFTIDGDKVRAVVISPGSTLGNGFVIKDGPKPGTKLVKNPPASLADGQTIKEKSS